MPSRTKEEEVQFYLDRSQEAVLTFLRSVVSNPRLSEDERFRALRAVGDHHRAISDLVLARIVEGERKGNELAAQVLATRN